MLGNAEMILAASSAQPSAETFTTVMDHVAQGFEALGALILVVGIVWSFVLAVVAWRRSGKPSKGYLALRTAIGGTLLLGLKILVAADLRPYGRCRTHPRQCRRSSVLASTAQHPRSRSPALILGLIVLIRTVLSFSDARRPGPGADGIRSHCRP